jgi:hypothetical protein
MPRISSFYGIVIWMYYDEPQYEVVHISMPAMATMRPPSTSTASRRAQKMVVEWAKEHQTELRENWDLARKHRPPHPIDPLG